jgi:hypothetical protein
MDFGLRLAFAIITWMISASSGAQTRHTVRRDLTRHVGKVGRAALGQLISFVAERTEPKESARGIRVDELIGECTQVAMAPLGVEEFVPGLNHLRASPELHGKIKKSGTRYFEMALTATRGAAGARS